MAGKRGNPNWKPGTSGNPRGGRARRSIHDGAPDVTYSTTDRVTLHRTDTLAARALRARSDGYRNIVSGLGTIRDRSSHTHFHYDPLTFDQCMELGRGDDMYARACEALPKDADRKGYDIIVTDDEEGEGKDLAEGVRADLDLLGADAYVLQTGIQERMYGGGAIMLGANDGSDDLTEPLDENKIISLDFLTPLEARELIPLYGYADPRAPKYGQPEIYQLVSRSVLPSHSGKYAAVTMLIHESRLLVFPGLRVSRYQVMQANGGWGDSIGVRMWRVLRAFNEVYGSVEHLVGDFAQAVYKLKGLYESLADDDDTTFLKRLQAMDAGRSTIRALVLDAEDDFSRETTPLSGVQEVMREFGVRLAAAADMPITRLFGTSPAGMNATGESDITLWDDRVGAYQKDKVKPHLRRLIQILMRLRLKGDPLPEKWDVKFRPLRQPSEKDVAQAHLAQSQADLNEVNAGISSPEEIAMSRHGGTEYSYDTRISFAARERQEQIASPPVTPEEKLAMQGKLAVNHPDYVPPPKQGTANENPDVAPPGPAAAPDKNTPPVSILGTED